MSYMLLFTLRKSFGQLQVAKQNHMELLSEQRTAYKIKII